MCPLEEKKALQMPSVVSFLCQLWLWLYAAHCFYQIFISENGKVLDPLLAEMKLEPGNDMVLFYLAVKGLPVLFVLLFSAVERFFYTAYKEGEVTSGASMAISLATVVLMYVFWYVVLVPAYMWTLTSNILVCTLGMVIIYGTVGLFILRVWLSGPIERLPQGRFKRFLRNYILNEWT